MDTTDFQEFIYLKKQQLGRIINGLEFNIKVSSYLYPEYLNAVKSNSMVASVKNIIEPAIPEYLPIF